MKYDGTVEWKRRGSLTVVVKVIERLVYKQQGEREERHHCKNEKGLFS